MSNDVFKCICLLLKNPWLTVQEVMLRRLKRDVMAELPPKRRQVVRLPRPKPADWPNQELAEGKCFILLPIPANNPMHCPPPPRPPPSRPQRAWRTSPSVHPSTDRYVSHRDHSLDCKLVCLRAKSSFVLLPLPPPQFPYILICIQGHCSADAEEDSGSEDGQDDPRPSSSLHGSSPDAMSKSHQTGLAKLPNGLEWLMNAIGGARRGNPGANPLPDEPEPAPKFLIFAHHKYEQGQMTLSLHSIF